MIEVWQLRQRQGLKLDMKIKMSLKKIREWYESHKGNVYVSFSGGKDSTVLLHLVRKLYPDIEAVFIDTGLEYPEIKNFVRTFDNVTTIRPTMLFSKVIKVYGYPVVSKKVARQIRDLQNPTRRNKATRRLYFYGIKRDGTTSRNFKLPLKWKFLIKAPFKISEQCCYVMKKQPIKRYFLKSKKKGFVGTMATDSRQRETAYLQTGCNNFKRGVSTPLAFWTEKDIWDYIKKFKLKYCSIYDTGVSRTGCMYCMFGLHLEKHPNRFELMKKTHPQLYEYCMNKLGIKKVLQYVGLEFGEVAK